MNLQPFGLKPGDIITPKKMAVVQGGATTVRIEHGVPVTVTRVYLNGVVRCELIPGITIALDGHLGPWERYIPLRLLAEAAE